MLVMVQPFSSSGTRRRFPIRRNSRAKVCSKNSAPKRIGVGDAHELSKFFGTEFDAVFSLAVFEHFAMPWVVAAEINKVLKIGGLTFHSTHFAFPLHERPWDFWRYTGQSLWI